MSLYIIAVCAIWQLKFVYTSIYICLYLAYKDFIFIALILYNNYNVARFGKYNIVAQ